MINQPFVPSPPTAGLCGTLRLACLPPLLRCSPALQLSWNERISLKRRQGSEELSNSDTGTVRRTTEEPLVLPLGRSLRVSACFVGVKNY